MLLLLGHDVKRHAQVGTVAPDAVPNSARSAMLAALDRAPSGHNLWKGWGHPVTFL